MKAFFTSCILSINILSGYAQDIFVGNWEMISANQENTAPIKLTFKIGAPEKNILYPAELHLQCDSFNATYHLLLAKKNSRQLAIGKIKYPISTSPFSIDSWTILLNGTLDFSKDVKDNPMLTLSRIFTKKFGIPFPEAGSFPIQRIPTAKKIRDFLQNSTIQLRKINDDIWNDTATLKILQPRESPTYYGLIDTIFVNSKNSSIHFIENKDNDIITVKINKDNILDQIDSRKNRDNEDFQLDTGLNIIILFADDYGNRGTSTAKVNLELGNTSKMLDFNEKENIAATFIAAKVFLKYNKEDDTKFQEYYSYDNDLTPINTGVINPTNKNGNPIPNNKIIGSLVSKSQQLTFAIWDDAVEDGDSISLSINDNWIVKGFPVLKKPQFLTVTLQPGPNVITFMADNLGSIIPNTSVLEIIDGKKRKSFYIETDLDLNNLIRIYYDTNTN